MPANAKTSRFLIIGVALLAVLLVGMTLVGRLRIPAPEQEGFVDGVVRPGMETSVPATQPGPPAPSLLPRKNLSARASVAGSIRTEDGLPVAGAVVAWVPQASTLAARGFERTPINFSAPRFSTVSDSEGRFGFELLPLGAIRIGVQPPAASGLLASEERIVELKADELHPPVDFVLPMGDRLIVRTVDAQGRPVAGVRLNWVAASRIRGSAWGPISAETDAAGNHEIKGLASRRDIVSLEGRHPDYLDAFLSLPSELETDSVELVLQPRHLLTLAVVDESTGAPIPAYQYTVMATAADQWSFGPLTRVNAEDGITTFTLNPSPGATRRILVAELNPSGKPTGRRGAAVFPAGPSSLTEAVVVMVGPGSTIAGSARHSVTGEPVAGAVVRQFLPSFGDGSAILEVPEAFRTPEVTTDEDGRFTMVGLVEGQYDLIAEAAGLRTVGVTSIIVDESFDTSNQVTLQLTPTGLIRGVVTGQDGKPLTGSIVDLYNEGARRSNRTRTDSEGQFLFPDASPTSYRLTLWLDESGTEFQQQRFVLAPDEDRTADFDLSQCVELTGTLRVDGQLWYAAQLVNFELMSADWSAEQQFSSALKLLEAGRYRVLIPPGDWQLVMTSRGSAGGWGENLRLAAMPREQRHDFTVRVGRLRVEILLRGGSNLVPGSSISLAQRMSEEGPLMEDVASMILGDGTPVGIFTRLNPGTYRASIYSPGTNRRLLAQSSWVEVLPDQTAVIRLEWRDVDASGLTPVARAQRQLQQMGYNPGPVDGILGPVTSTALRRLQADHGLRPTGQLDEETIRFLNVKIPQPQ